MAQAFTLRIAIVSALFLATATMLAQNWQVFPPGQNSYYLQDDSLNYYRLKADSVYATGNTTQYFLDPTLEAGGTLNWGMCSGTVSGHLLTGNPIIQQPNRLIFSYWNFPIMLPLNEDTVVSSFQQSVLSAFVADKRDTFYNGANDSIIEIKMTSTDTTLTDCLQSGSTILSKNNGLLAVNACLTFLGTDIYINNNTKSPGKTKRKAPIFDQTKVYDFEVGDVFHFYNFFLINSSGDKKRQNYTVLSKVIDSSNFTYTYTFDFAEEFHEDHGPSQTWTYTYDTIQLTYNWIIPIDSTPYSLNQNGYGQFEDDWRNLSRRAYLSRLDPIGVYHDSCYQYQGSDISRTTVRYVEGLGCVISYTDGYNGSTTFESGFYLIYLNKGGQTWGTPYHVGLDESTLQSVAVFPNPASDILHITGLKTDKPIGYNLVDLVGKNLQSGEVSGNQPEINIQNLPAGIHFLVLDQTRVVKFLVQRN